MYKIKFLFSFQFLLLNSILFAQDLGQKVVFEERIKLKGKGQCLFIPKGDSSRLLIFDSELVRVADLNKGEIVKEYTSKGFLLHKRDFIGHASSEGITLFYGSPVGKINYAFLNPSKTNASLGVLNYDRPEDEFYLASFSENDQFFILTISKKSSILNFYIFSSFYEFEKKSIDLSSHFSVEPLFDELKDQTTHPGSIKIKRPYLTMMDDVFDPKISKSNDLNKLFIESGKAYITMDGSSFQTRLLEISLTDFEFKTKSFSQSGSCFSSSIYSVNNSNSYINRDKLYTARSCKEEIFVGIYDLNGSQIKNFNITEDQIESGNNTLFNIFDLDNAKRTLKVMSKLDVGVLAQEIDSIILVEVGGHKNYSTTGGGFNGAPVMTSTTAKSSSVYGILDLFDEEEKLKVDDSDYYKLGVRRRGLEGSFARFILPFGYKEALLICHYDSYSKKFKIERFD